MSETNEIMVDSSILSAYKDGDMRARELIRNAIDRNINIWSMTKFDRKSEIGFTGIFSFLDVIDLDNDVAQHAGSLLRENLDMDSSLGIERAVVAAYAGLAGKNIVTNNPEEYARFNCDTKNLQSYVLSQT